MKHSNSDPSKSTPPVEDQGGDARARAESGMPGGGAGRRDVVERTGVYPMSGTERPPGGAELKTPGTWGQGERGEQGYADAGGSELRMQDGVLLGGTTAGPGGEPTIQIHGPPPVDLDRPRLPGASEHTEKTNTKKTKKKRKK